MIPDKALIAAPASPTITAASAIAAPAAVAGGAAAAVGRASGTVAGEPVSQREAVVRRIRIGVAAAAARPGARTRGAVLHMGHQGIADDADGSGADQGIDQKVHSPASQARKPRFLPFGRTRQMDRSLIIQTKYGTLAARVPRSRERSSP